MTFSSYFPPIEQTLKEAPEGQTRLFLQFSQCFATEDLDSLIAGLSHFFRSLQQHGERASVFQQLEEESAAHSCSLQTVLSFVAEQAILNEKGDLLLDIFDELAEWSASSIIWFLCAWLSLNLDDPAQCVSYCQRVKYPYSPILSIQGQALLELVRTEEAIASLEQAVDIAPRDLISWFFLTKAYFATGDELNAWLGIEQCLKLEQNHPEILTLMGIMACQAQDSPTEWIERSWAALYLFARQKELTGAIAAMLYVIAFKLGDPKRAKKLNQELNLEDIKQDPDFLRNLGQILKMFQSLQWRDENQDFLEKIS